LEKFYRLFLNKLKFSCDSFDRIVLNGYKPSFHKANNLTYYFKFILEHFYVNQILLFSVTDRYNKAVDAFAVKHQLCCDWVEKEALYKKHDNAFLNIKDIGKLLQAQGHFTADLISERIAYWLVKIGPKLEKHPMCHEYFIDQIEYCRNFIFKSHSYLSELFKRSCELSLQLISTDNVRQIFASKAKEEDISKRLNRIEEGYYVFKAWFKRCSIKQYRKYSNFLRYELTCNHLPDMKVKKALGHLSEFKQKAEEALDRYSETKAEMMNCLCRGRLFYHTFGVGNGGTN